MPGFFMLCSRGGFVSDHLSDVDVLCVCWYKALSQKIIFFLIVWSPEVSRSDKLMITHTLTFGHPGVLGLIVLWWLARRCTALGRVSVWTQPGQRPPFGSRLQVFWRIFVLPLPSVGSSNRTSERFHPALKTWKLPWCVFSYAILTSSYEV